MQILAKRGMSPSGSIMSRNSSSSEDSDNDSLHNSKEELLNNLMHPFKEINLFSNHERDHNSSSNISNNTNNNTIKKTFESVRNRSTSTVSITPTAISRDSSISSVSKKILSNTKTNFDSFNSKISSTFKRTNSISSNNNSGSSNSSSNNNNNTTTTNANGNNTNTNNNSGSNTSNGSIKLFTRKPSLSNRTIENMNAIGIEDDNHTNGKNLININLNLNLNLNLNKTGRSRANSAASSPASTRKRSLTGANDHLVDISDNYFQFQKQLYSNSSTDTGNIISNNTATTQTAPPQATTITTPSPSPPPPPPPQPPIDAAYGWLLTKNGVLQERR